MPGNWTAQRCADRRARFLAYLMERAPRHWAAMIRHGARSMAPAEWRDGPPAEQAERMARVQVERVADSPAYAVDEPAVRALRSASVDLRLPMAAELLPATRGLLMFQVPIGVDPTDGCTPLTAATWGPSLPTHYAGVWLTWWFDAEAAAAREVREGRLTEAEARTGLAHVGPWLPAGHLSLPFVPVLETRLWPRRAADRVDPEALMIRTIAGSWLALTRGLLVATPAATELTSPQAAGSAGIVGLHMVRAGGRDPILLASGIRAAADGAAAAAQHRYGPVRDFTDRPYPPESDDGVA
ncbi:hypothetical protein [Yinghuangia seranimata]|uniref:hypothetical protein n=1 Tax=Yinghuangia seranimata TaxID=408067 RepID=UPI00248C0FB1|nr:hypothetical protein [Yinghuangia seranimata]MDI2125782.1 hypothetical protein [Yinghuangia seranimata]